MSITGGNLFFNSASDTSNPLKKMYSTQMKQNGIQLRQAARDLQNEIKNNRTGYEMAQENVDFP